MKKFSELFEKKKGDPCWKGYTQVGMKKKNGKDVPNCVPADGVEKAKGYKESTEIEEGYYNVVVRDKNGKVNSEKRFKDKAAAQRHHDRIKKVNKVGDTPAIHYVNAANENVKSADRKPEVFTDPEGKKRVRMVPVNRNIVKEKSVSQAQQKMMGMALAYKRGEMDDASPEVKKMANSMSLKDLEDFAKTKHKGLPAKKEGVEENRMSVLQQIRLKKEKEDRKKKNDNSSDQYQRMKKKQYGGMMGGLKKEEVELDEWQKETPWKKVSGVRKDKYGNVIKPKNIAKHLAKAAQKQTAKEDLDELSINTLKSYRKKAVDDVASNKKADQRAKGVAKSSNKIYRKEFDALYKKESAELDEMDLSKHDTKKLLQFHRKYADRKMGPSDANQVRAVRRELIKRGALKESVDLDEAKGTGVKKFVRGMRVAKTSNPNMKGTVIKGGDNMKKGVEVEWDSGTTTVASGKYLTSISKNESVDLDEGKAVPYVVTVKKTQHSVQINAKSGLEAREAGAKQFKVKPFEVDVSKVYKEAVEVEEAKLSVGDRVTLKPNKNTLDQSLIGKAGVVTGMVGSKPTVKFANGKTIAVSPKDLTINESVELDEGRNEALKALEGLAKKGGIDKATFQKAHDLYKETKFKELKTLISRSDTDPSEAIASVIQRHDTKAFNSMYPRAKSGDYLRNITKESVQHTFFSLREARRDAAKDLYFDTYSAAVQAALADVKKKGFEVDEDDWHDSITTGSGKPGRGKTVRHTIGLTKGGKPQRKALHIQVYNRDTDKKTYELNHYVS